MNTTKQLKSSRSSIGKNSGSTETTPKTPKHLAVVPESANSFSKVRILGKTYTIGQLPESVGDNEFGQANYLRQSIHYNERLAIDEMKDTIIHEMVHCIDHAVCTNLTEAQVHALSSGFYALLRDNPEFFTWVINDV